MVNGLPGMSSEPQRTTSWCSPFSLVLYTTLYKVPRWSLQFNSSTGLPVGDIMATISIALPENKNVYFHLKRLKRRRHWLRLFYIRGNWSATFPHNSMGVGRRWFKYSKSITRSKGTLGKHATQSFASTGLAWSNLVLHNFHQIYWRWGLFQNTFPLALRVSSTKQAPGL